MRPSVIGEHLQALFQTCPVLHLHGVVIGGGAVEGVDYVSEAGIGSWQRYVIDDIPWLPVQNLLGEQPATRRGHVRNGDRLLLTERLLHRQIPVQAVRELEVFVGDRHLSARRECNGSDSRPFDAFVRQREDHRALLGRYSL